MAGRPARKGGFDAVIGNPPWDRIKLQEVEWFATREPDIALELTAAARRAAIRRLRRQGAPLAGEYDAALAQADQLGRMIRKSGHYPLLGRGDINLYSLFVERAMSLVKPTGFVGLLTPSGIYADLTAAKFFKSVSASGRSRPVCSTLRTAALGTDLPPFFPDVDSRFKFCAITFGGDERTHSIRRLCAILPRRYRNHRRPRSFFPRLRPDDFTMVNPNTGTAPVFRTRRDSDITRQHLRSNILHWLIVRAAYARRAWPDAVCSNAGYDERLRPVPHSGTTRLRWFLSRSMAIVGSAGTNCICRSTRASMIQASSTIGRQLVCESTQKIFNRPLPQRRGATLEDALTTISWLAITSVSGIAGMPAKDWSKRLSLRLVATRWG